MQNRKSVQLPPHCRTRSSGPKAAQSAALQDAGAQVLGRVHHRGAFQERNELRRFWSALLCGAVGRKSSVERFDLIREPPVDGFQQRRKAPHSKTLARGSSGGFIIGALSRNRTNSEGFGVRRCAALFGRKSSVERFDFFRQPPGVRFQKRRKAPHSKTLARWSSGGFIIGALSRNRTNSEGFGVRRCAALLGAKVASSGLISFASRPSSGSKSVAKRRTPRRWRAG